MPWGFRFLHHPYHREQIDLKTFDWSTVEVRHATNLYESMAYLLSFGILMFLFWKKEGWKKPGLVFGAFLVLIFGFRFLIEFLKEGQTDNDNFVHLWTGINTGQWLSVPLVFTGLVLIYLARKKEPLNA
jgi:prolipoprotein diacylglyceryltransferase